MKALSLDLIETDGGTQVRIALSQTTLSDYQEVYEDTPDAMPPLVVFYDGSSYWLGDGFHRYHAARTAGLAMLPCDVRKGSLTDAKAYAIGANATHGLRRSNEDKRRAVLMALELWPDMSDRGLAEKCGVGHHLVSKLRSDQLGAAPSCEPQTKRVGRDGKARKLPETSPAPEPWPGPDTDEEPPDADEIEFEDPEPSPTRLKRYDGAVRSFVSKCNTLRAEFAGLADANEFTAHHYNSVVEQDFDIALNNAKNVITAKRPHVVCPVCNGERCEECNGLGVMTRGEAGMVQ